MSGFWTVVHLNLQLFFFNSLDHRLVSHILTEFRLENAHLETGCLEFAHIWSFSFIVGKRKRFSFLFPYTVKTKDLRSSQILEGTSD